MSDELSMFLLSSGGRRSSLSADRLEMMGKEAAARLIEKGVPLNTSVVKIASETPDINHEQVRRVCEFANTAVYLHQHDLNKTANAGHSYPQFALADPEVVLNKLAAGHRAEHTFQRDTEYSIVPRQRITSDKLEGELEKLFLGENGERSKTASIAATRESAVSDIYDTKSSLKATKEVLAHTKGVVDVEIESGREAYYDGVKRHILEGGSFGDVLYAATGTGCDSEKIACELSCVIERLLREKVATAAYLTNGADTMQKVAHRVLNDEHPFVSGLRTVIEKVAEAEVLDTSIAEINGELAKVNGFIREALLAR